MAPNMGGVIKCIKWLWKRAGDLSLAQWLIALSPSAFITAALPYLLSVRWGAPVWVLALTVVLAFPTLFILAAFITNLFRAAGAPWWQGKTRFLITEAACALCGIKPSQYPTHERAVALANDILGGVRNGQIRVADEAYTINNIGLTVGQNPSKYPKKPDANLETQIGLRTLNAFARNRDLKLLWPIPANTED